jgi:hypothetical protein
VSGIEDPETLLRKALERGQSVKFGRGVVGKTSYAAVATIGLWIAIVFRLSTNPWLNLGLVTAGLFGTAVCIWFIRGTQRFARENPAQALLEGAQFVEYQKWEAEVKGISGPIGGRAIPDPSRPRLGSGEYE